MLVFPSQWRFVARWVPLITNSPFLVAPVCQHPSFLLLMPKAISLFCFVDSNWYFIFYISLPCLHHVTSSFWYILVFSNPNIDMMSVIHPYPLIPICPCLPSEVSQRCISSLGKVAKRSSTGSPSVQRSEDWFSGLGPPWSPLMVPDDVNVKSGAFAKEMMRSKLGQIWNRL